MSHSHNYEIAELSLIENNMPDAIIILIFKLVGPEGFDIFISAFVLTPIPMRLNDFLETRPDYKHPIEIWMGVADYNERFTFPKFIKMEQEIVIVSCMNGPVLDNAPWNTDDIQCKICMFEYPSESEEESDNPDNNDLTHDIFTSYRFSLLKDSGSVDRSTNIHTPACKGRTYHCISCFGDVETNLYGKYYDFIVNCEDSYYYHYVFNDEQALEGYDTHEIDR